MVSVKAIIGEEAYSTKIDYKTGSFISDEPINNRGKNQGPSPLHLVASSLASCTAITLKMYSDRNKWNYENITVTVDLDFLETGVKFIRNIIFEGAINEDNIKRLLNIANRCPVHKLLSGNLDINSQIQTL